MDNLSLDRRFSRALSFELSSCDEQKQRLREEASHYFAQLAAQAPDVVFYVFLTGIAAGEFEARTLSNLASGPRSAISMQRDSGEEWAGSLVRLCKRESCAKWRIRAEASTTIGLQAGNWFSEIATPPCCAAVSFSASEQLASAGEVVQWRVFAVDRCGRKCTTVHTARFDACPSAIDFFEKCNRKALAATIFKMCVADSGRIQMLDDCVRTIVSATSARGGLPGELASLSRDIYAIKRGPLGGRLLQSDEELLCFRLAMSTAPLDITKATYCSDMVRMDLTACGEVNISNVPVSTASLSPSSVIVLDRGTDVYLWRGRDVVDAASPQLAAARHLCRDLLASRTAAFPAPRMSEYAQTDSMVRFFLVHLDASSTSTALPYGVFTDDLSCSDWLKTLCKK